MGVAGIRDFNTVKCLHCHLAHHVDDIAIAHACTTPHSVMHYVSAARAPGARQPSRRLDRAVAIGDAQYSDLDTLGDRRGTSSEPESGERIRGG